MVLVPGYNRTHVVSSFLQKKDQIRLFYRDLGICMYHRTTTMICLLCDSSVVHTWYYEARKGTGTGKF